MLWFLIMITLSVASAALLLVWRLREDAEYERTRRHRRWWDF